MKDKETTKRVKQIRSKRTKVNQQIKLQKNVV